MSDIKLSIIIPVYNAELYLTRALESVLASSLTELEIIVVDDASPGNCKEIVTSYMNDKRVRYIRHEKNRGLFAARMTGIENAQGEYLVHLDPDDYIINDIYTKAYEAALANSLDFVLFNVIQEDESANRWIEKENVLPALLNISGADALDHILKSRSKAWIWHVSWNKLMKTEKVKELLHHFSQEEHLNMYEDLLYSCALFTRFFDTKSIGVVEETGLVYFRHNESITKKSGFASYVKKFHDIRFVLKKIEILLKFYKLDMRYLKEFRKLSCYILQMHSPVHVKADNIKEKLRLKAIKYRYKAHNSLRCKGYDDIQDGIESITKKIKQRSLEEIAVFGTGEFAKRLKKALVKNGVEVRFFISSDEILKGNALEGVYILNIEDALQESHEGYIAIASMGSYEKIETMLREQKNGESITYITAE